MERVASSLLLSILAATFLCTVEASYSATANIYDDRNMISVQDDNRIFGYYSSVGDRFSCIFFFFAKTDIDLLKNQIGYNVISTKTFSIDLDSGQYDYAHRATEFDIQGVLYLHDNDFVLKTIHPQAGCMSSAGMFENSPGERGVIQYHMQSQIPAIGIRVVDKKTYLYRQANSREKSGYLVQGDIVLLIKKKSGLSYVRYVNPNVDSGRIAAGWVDSVNLVDPFPSKIK